MSDEMIVCDIEQRTKEWYALRKTKITATDACVIMGFGFKSKNKLWQEKLSEEFIEESINENMWRGIEYEPLARELYQLNHDVQVRPRVIIRGWAMASMDGITDDLTRAVEIKCPGENNHALAVSGRVPSYYMPQLQHQIHVCGLASIDYFSFFDGEGVCINVKRDTEYIIKMLSEEMEFFEHLQNKTPPTSYVYRTDREWVTKSLEYTEAKNKRLFYEMHEEILKSDLIEMSYGENIIGGGIKLQFCNRKGSIDYSKIPELIDVDLEKYRKNGTRYALIK